MEDARASSPWICLVIVSFMCYGVLAGAAPFGVNWGTISQQPLPPGIVTQMLKDNNITRVKLFDANYDVVKALGGSGIEIMVAAPNDMLVKLAKSEKAAKDWVRENVTRYLVDGGPKVRYVAVGNEPFLIAYNGTYQNVTYPALVNIQKALAAAGVSDRVVATVPFNADVLCGDGIDCSSPSAGAFRPDIASLMATIVESLNSTGAPFSLNIYPFLSLALSSDFPKEYAFFGSYALTDVSGAVYHNVFDASYDTLVSALTKIGYPQMPIVIGEIGWPTDGNQFATIANAQRFMNEALQHISSNQGTPLRPNEDFNVYLFGLLDENLKSIDPGDFERHWGIFYSDGNPKYQVDFSGSGNGNVWPKPSVGVQYLPQNWCILNQNVLVDSSVLQSNMDYACSRTDCTALADGGSCSLLSQNTKASYSFNNYFQFNLQDPQGCDFDGLATVTESDPSVGDCKFQIGLNYEPTTSGSAPKQRWWTGAVAILVALTFVLMISTL